MNYKRMIATFPEMIIKSLKKYHMFQKRKRHSVNRTLTYIKNICNNDKLLPISN
jgi:hypothetical protein